PCSRQGDADGQPDRGPLGWLPPGPRLRGHRMVRRGAPAPGRAGGRLMVVTEPKVEVRLRAPLAVFMDARGMSVRDLQYKVNNREHAWSRGTVGHLRKHTDRSVNPILAKRIAKALDTPYAVLFT